MKLLHCVVLLCAFQGLFARKLTNQERLYEEIRKSNHGDINSGAVNYEPGELPSHWFNQTLDHFNPADDRTWLQKYIIDPSFYEEGGPIFLLISGEAALYQSIFIFGHIRQYALKHKALMIAIEHRFYGESRPTADMSVENLVYLTSEQALADIANFIVGYTGNNTWEVTEENKWVTFGGSYAGSLSAWARYKYPHLVHAAVASSAPLLAKMDFFEYKEVVEDSLDTTGPECTDAIRSAFKRIEKVMWHPKGDIFLTRTFKKCFFTAEAVNYRLTNFEEIAVIYSSIYLSTQPCYHRLWWKDKARHLSSELFNSRGCFGKYIFHIGHVFTNFWKLGENFLSNCMQIVRKRKTIDRLCKVMVSRSNPLRDLASAIKIVKGDKCIQVEYKDSIKDLQKTTWNSSWRPWLYQTCVEFGYYQTTNSEHQPFGHHLPLSFYIQECQDLFGPEFTKERLEAGINKTNTMYGGRNPKVTRVVFINGSIDPWHALGILEDLNPETPAIFIEGTSHCADMFSNNDGIVPGVKEAHQRITLLLGKWFEEED